MLLLDGIQMWALDDLDLLVVVLLISCKEGNRKLVASNLLFCLLYPWSLVPLPCESKYWKLGCDDWIERLLGLYWWWT